MSTARPVITASNIETRSLRNLAANAGPVPAILREDDVLDVCVNPDGLLWVNRLGHGFQCEGEFSSVDASLLLSGIATVRGLELNEHHPILETIFPLTGDRIEGLIPPVVTAPAFAIRTRPKKIFTLREMAEQGVFTRKTDPLNQKRHRDNFLEKADGLDHVDVVELASIYRRNTLFVGPTGSGKTTGGNAIIADWLQQTPGDRVVIIEDTPELQCSIPNHLQLLATSRVSQAELLVAALRLIPKRIVVGEVRDTEPARVLIASWNTGHQGGIATIHADDALSGLRKLESLIGAHDAAVRERIAAAVGLVIFIDAEDSLPVGRKVREVVAVKGYDPARQDYDLIEL